MADPTQDQAFQEAFVEALTQGKEVFSYKGKTYTTKGNQLGTGDTFGPAPKKPPFIFQDSGLPPTPGVESFAMGQGAPPWGVADPTALDLVRVPGTWMGPKYALPQHMGGQRMQAPVTGVTPGAAPVWPPVPYPVAGSGGGTVPPYLPEQGMAGESLQQAAGDTPLQQGQFSPTPQFPAVFPPELGAGGGGQASLPGGSQPSVLPQTLNPKLVDTAPATPEAQSERQSQWEQLFTRLQSHPDLWLSLIKFGTDMMQPIQPGQTFAGHTGRALQGSVDYASMMQQMRTEQSLRQAQTEQAKAGAKQTEAVTTQQLPAQVKTEEARAKQLDATTEKLLQEIEEGKNLRGFKTDELKARVDLLKKQGILTEAQAQDYNKRLDRDPAYKTAMIEQLKAHAAYYRQHGQAAGSTAQFNRYRWDKLTEEHTLDPDVQDLIKAGNMPEAQRLITERVNRDWFAGGAKIAVTEDEAESTIQTWRGDYAAALQANDKSAKGKTFSQYVERRLMGTTLPPATQSAILARAKMEDGPPGGAAQPLSRAAPSAAATPSVPQRPATVPLGSAYSPSRKQWRDQQGQLYDEQGNKVGQ